MAVATPKVTAVQYLLYTHFLFNCIFINSQGLVVPVVRNVNVMNYADIEKEIASLGQKVIYLHVFCTMLFFSKKWLQKHPQFLLYFLIHIDVLMLCRKFEVILSSNFWVMAIF